MGSVHGETVVSSDFKCESARSLNSCAPVRTPVVLHGPNRNAIGAWSGSYGVYRALAATVGTLPKGHRPDWRNTQGGCQVGPFASWSSGRIVSFDPWGAHMGEEFHELVAMGEDVRPTIAVTRARMDVPEIVRAMEAGRLKPDGRVLLKSGELQVTKAAIDLVWYLPGVAARFGVTEEHLRQGLYKHTGGMYEDLIKRPEIKLFLPPIGGLSVYFFGDPNPRGSKQEVSLRVHDECNGSDVFGSDICTCRPYLTYAIEHAVQVAQSGGRGMVFYFRKEGRALGEVTKYLVYNARKQQKGGDQVEEYFNRTLSVAGVADMRFQELMPDALHWAGVERVDYLVSMSDVKYKAIVQSGIKVMSRVPIPDNLIPCGAHVEIEAKKAAGYYSG